ncbi:MAG: hypothetical protein EOP45_21380 [Sphingobacteriaceae bacterium]|nr:MAG: hypothetical protein EOP45_21380 [Sphingobacteriaceae bacterium]
MILLTSIRLAAAFKALAKWLIGGQQLATSQFPSRSNYAFFPITTSPQPSVAQVLLPHPPPRPLLYVLNAIRLAGYQGAMAW